VPESFDVAVVGSGPAGSLATAGLLEGGARVLMLDVSNDDDHYRQLVPDRPFWELRAQDPEQRRYFLGDRLEGVPGGEIRVGAQLTPPRQFVFRDTERWLPVGGDGFEPMQSLALGGLGAAWGAASFTYTAPELRQLGIFEPAFERLYDRVAEIIGVSGDPDDDAAGARGESTFSSAASRWAARPLPCSPASSETAARTPTSTWTSGPNRAARCFARATCWSSSRRTSASTSNATRWWRASRAIPRASPCTAATCAAVRR
jgi:choline dehydrogenase-like flavoprotein